MWWLIIYSLKQKNKMARRKRRTHHRSSRRRSVGAMSLTAANPLVIVGSLAAGYFLAATPLNNALDKVTGGKIDGKLLGAGQAGIGALLLLKKGKKTLPLTIAGGIMAGAGVKRLMDAMKTTTTTTETAAVTGYKQVPVIGGYKQVPVIGMNGYNVPASMNGYQVPASAKIMGACGSDLLG